MRRASAMGGHARTRRPQSRRCGNLTVCRVRWMSSHRVTYCVDVGSVRGGNFGWARVTDGDWEVGEGDSAAVRLVEALERDCAGDGLVSIGFESPLFLPLRSDAMDLTRARASWEHSSFAGGLGASVLVTGLVEAAYVLRDRSRVVTSDAASVDRSELVVWEAFVSGRSTAEMTVPTCPGGEHGVHACDALVAAVEWHRWSGGLALSSGAVRWARDFRFGRGGVGLDLIAAVLGRPAVVANTAEWTAAVLQLPKPLHTSETPRPNDQQPMGHQDGASP